MPPSAITSQGSASGSSQQAEAQDQAKLRRLQDRDRRVRTHEKAHSLAGGRHVSGMIRYKYETGPDGRRYAVGGRAHATAGGSTPGDVIDKAQALRRAAAAPTRPSTGDRIAMNTSFILEQQARSEISQARETQSMAGKAGSQNGSALSLPLTSSVISIIA